MTKNMMKEKLVRILNSNASLRNLGNLIDVFRSENFKPSLLPVYL